MCLIRTDEFSVCHARLNRLINEIWAKRSRSKQDGIFFIQYVLQSAKVHLSSTGIVACLNILNVR